MLLSTFSRPLTVGWGVKNKWIEESRTKFVPRPFITSRKGALSVPNLLATFQGTNFTNVEWICLRAEPVVFVNDLPMAPRHPKSLNVNLDYLNRYCFMAFSFVRSNPRKFPGLIDLKWCLVQGLWLTSVRKRRNFSINPRKLSIFYQCFSNWSEA